MFNFDTDLADERMEICKKNIKKGEIDGISNQTENYSEKLNVNRVKVLNKNGEKRINKKIGNYITINIDNIETITYEEIEQATKIFSKELNSLIKNKNKILVAGLGNIDTTADSIGPNIIKHIEITRNIKKYKPELLDINAKEISAISPGVLGTTGIETQEIIKAIADKIKPDLIIVIDALASNNISRLLKTIQLCDTGITPGGGVDNKRREISFETMGVKVIAIGVPTVVNASVIAASSLDLLTKKYKQFDIFKDNLKHISSDEKQKIIAECLNESNYNLIVMPKEIDDLVDNMQNIIAKGINLALKQKS